jgi:hypothetical protein
MGYDIHIARHLSREQALDCIAHVFGVARDEVIILQDYEQIIPLPPGRIVCGTRQRTGEFPTTLEIFVGEQVEQALPEHEVASRIARFLPADCLISDDSLNPFSWTLVSADGKVQQVFVDTDALDRDELRINRRQP